MVKSLKTTASDKEILEWNLEEMASQMYDLTCQEGYEDTDEYERLSTAIRDTKNRLKNL